MSGYVANIGDEICDFYSVNTYNLNGDVSQEEIFHFNNLELCKYTYVYTANGLLSSKKYYLFGGAYVFQNEETYEYRSTTLYKTHKDDRYYVHVFKNGLICRLFEYNLSDNLMYTHYYEYK